MCSEPGPSAAIAAGLLIAGVFAAFVSERRPPAVTAFIGAALAMALGLVDTGEVLAAIANPAPATIGAMFVLSAALVRTGVLEHLIGGLSGLAARHPRRALLAFFAVAAGASAVLNNTPVVLVLIPVAIGLARHLGTVPSRLLMPLSFIVILGGTMTLVGTSTNLLVDGIAQNVGLAAFGLFEIAPLGLIVLLAGGGFLALAAPHLLPARAGPVPGNGATAPRTWMADLFIPAGSALIGAAPNEITALTRGGGRIVDVIRGDASLRRTLGEVRLEAGDTVVVKTRDTELMAFAEGQARGAFLPGMEPGQMRAARVVEMLVGPESRAIGRSLGRLRWRRRFGVYPMALHRRGLAVTARMEDTRLAVGDTLLIEGAQQDLDRLAEDQRLIVLAPSGARAFRRTKAPIAIGTLAFVVLGAALGVAPILTLALIGVAVVLATGCIEADEGLAAMDGALLLLIISMLVLGSALDSSGAVAQAVALIAPLLDGVPPLVALALVYAVTSVLTELVTNNAVAVLLTPVAVGLATSLGVDPRAFVVAVMFGASASFATPIGYQTNTLVYSAGGYRFTDFLRVGVPMNLIVGVTTVLAIPLFWPL